MMRAITSGTVDMELTEIDFAECERALYADFHLKGGWSKFIMDIGPTIRIDAPDWVQESLNHKPYLFTSKEDHEQYEYSYRVYPGEKVRFDNLPPSSKKDSIPFENPHLHHLTVGKMYTVINCPQTRFGRRTWLTIRNDIGDLVRHYRGRFTKMNISGIEEPQDDDLL